MVDLKITELAEALTAIGADLIPIVKDVGTVPVTKKILASNLLTPKFVPLAVQLSSLDWDGDAHSDTAKTLIDLSVVFGVPAGVKAILAKVSMRDSGSAANDCIFWLSCNNNASDGIAWRSHGVGDDGFIDGTFIVPCDINGDVYYQVDASGANTMDVWLTIFGYWV